MALGLDLNTPAGFATATLSNLSTTLNGLGFAGGWDIQESAYGPDADHLVLFHVFKNAEVDFDAGLDQVHDTYARRVAEYKFVYVDGQSTEDLGREGSVYAFNALISGPNYYAAYRALLVELNKPAPGILRHPIFGNIRAKFKSADVTASSKERQAVALRLEFIESNFEVSFTSKVPTPKSKLAAAAAFISSLNQKIVQIQGYAAVASTALVVVDSLKKNFAKSFQDFLVSLNVSFNSGTSADVPALLPTSGSTSFPVATSTTGVYANFTPAEVQTSSTAPVTPAQAKDQLSALTEQAASLIVQIEGLNNGQGALMFYQETTTIRQAALSAKAALVQFLQTAQPIVVNYETPRLMSIREVCFENGIPVDQSQDILTLNPSLLSANYIPRGTTVQIGRTP